MDLQGEVLEGNRLASIEHKVHLACYNLRPEVNGVIHSHPRVATAFAAARKPLPAFLDEFGVYVGKEVRVAPYAMSGSAEIAEGVQEALGRGLERGVPRVARAGHGGDDPRRRR